MTTVDRQRSNKAGDQKSDKLDKQRPSKIPLAVLPTTPSRYFRPRSSHSDDKRMNTARRRQSETESRPRNLVNDNYIDSVDNLILDDSDSINDNLSAADEFRRRKQQASGPSSGRNKRDQQRSSKNILEKKSKSISENIRRSPLSIGSTSLVKNSSYANNQQRRKSLENHTDELNESADAFPEVPSRPFSRQFSVLPSIGQEQTDLPELIYSHTNRNSDTSSKTASEQSSPSQSRKSSVGRVQAGAEASGYFEREKSSASNYSVNVAQKSGSSTRNLVVSQKDKRSSGKERKLSPLQANLQLSTVQAKHAQVSNSGKLNALSSSKLSKIEMTANDNQTSGKISSRKKATSNSTVLKESGLKTLSKSEKQFNASSEASKISSSYNLSNESISNTTVSLAVKLPTGERVLRDFKMTDKLISIIRFAEIYSKCKFRGWELVCSDPKLVLSDMNKSIQEAGIPDKVLLHIQRPD